MALEEYEQEQSSPIRISRNGSVTRFAESRERSGGARSSASMAFLDDDDSPPLIDEPLEMNEAGTLRAESLTPRARPMPKRLSEEAREAEEAERQARILQPVDEPPKPRARRAKKAVPARRSMSDHAPAQTSEEEQMALPLKEPRPKTDSLVKQRQVLGFCCIVAAVLVLLAIISYSPDDASRSETRISDLPSLFLPHGDSPDPVRDAVRASADQAKNWLGLIGAMLANFLINKTIGYAAVLYPIFFGAWSLAFFRFTYKQRRRLTLATTFFLITAILFSATMGTASNFLSLPREWSGSVGQFLGLAFARAIGSAGAFIIYAAAFIVMLIFSIDLDIEKTFHRLKSWWNAMVMWSRRRMIEFWEKREVRLAAKEERREAERIEEEQAERLKQSSIAEKVIPAERAAAQVPETLTNDRLPALEENTEPKPAKLAVEPVVAEAASPQRPIAVQPVVAAEQSALRSERSAIPKPDSVGAAVAAAKETVAVAPTGNSSLLTPRTENQPLLKVRPAKQNEGANIPRLTRNGQERLGTHSKHFSRLTNGAVDHDEERTEPPQATAGASAPVIAEVTPIQSAAQSSETASPSASAENDVLQAPSTEGEEPPVDIIHNIDPSEDVIEPLKRKPREPNITASTAPVMLGDEKVLSNEALPHSVASEIPIPPPALLAADREIPKIADDLFYEEGERPVIPENPYQEMLTKYRNPSLELLTPADPKDALDANDEELAKKGRLLRDKLATFGVEIENITVTPGPVVTLYEFTPAEGVKVSRVENLTDDIALAMKARGIRIIAPIPGRGTIGVEIPNDTAKIVRIRSLLESDSFRNTKMNLPLALGMTISGDVYVDDLNKMPHLLIAGATGSGKSVGVNGILASLLYAKSPRDVKFVIVDPKKIELSLYKKLRKHYLIVSPEAGEDIVTTPAYAVLALKAVELEMERRYDKLAKAAVRSLADYNIKVAQGKLRSTQEEQHYHLPYIVVIIDELADLMITAAREIEEPICRIAQMARAVGIHMILATQRPSVDVITGVIKANFPARMAYQVATRVDSRTILDVMGAEQLMGNGDMLYQPSGTPKPIRLQSPYISTEEVEAMIDAVAMQDGDKLSYSRPWTLPSLRQDDDDQGVEIDDEDERDELFEEAARTIVRHQQGSVSLLQRRLKIGYSRAARVMDELEAAAIVGAFDGSKARQVLCESEAELEVVLEGLR